MASEDWKLGESLDALNDMLYGGYGKINGHQKVKLIWKNYEKNRMDLGFDLTKAYYENKLKYPTVFNIDFVNRKLDELKNHEGQTYFEIIQEIIAQHPNIELVPE